MKNLKNITLGKKIATGAMILLLGATLVGCSSAETVNPTGEPTAEEIQKEQEKEEKQLEKEEKRLEKERKKEEKRLEKEAKKKEKELEKEAKKKAKEEKKNGVEKSLTSEFLKQELDNKDFDSLEVVKDNSIININLDVQDNLTTNMMLRSNCTNLVDILKVIKDNNLLTDDVEVVKVNFIGDMTNGDKGVWIGTMYDAGTINSLDYENMLKEDIFKKTSGGTVSLVPSIRENIKEDSDFAFLK